MALSWSEQILPAGSQTVPVEIVYLDRTYIHLYVNGAEQTDFTWDSNTLIRFGTQLDEPSTITIVRRTDRSYLYILFAEGAAFIKENLDMQNTQFLHLAQELVEGRAIEGFYGDISMNGYRITHLGRGIELTDAVNVQQLNEVSDRVTSIEQTVITDTISYPWYTITTATTSSISPPFVFTKAAVYINGVCQTPGYSYDILSNVIHLADPVPAGTHVFVRLGEDVPSSQGYASAASLATVAATKLDATANAVSATKLTTARTIRTNLAATTAASFNGTADAAPGVTGILPVANGGTGASSAAGARAVLGAAALGANADITSLTGLTGGISGKNTAPAAGTIGQLLVSSPADTIPTSGTVTGLTPGLGNGVGVWDYQAFYRLNVPSGTSVTQTVLHIGNSTGPDSTTALGSLNWYEKYDSTQTITGPAVVTVSTPIRRVINDGDYGAVGKAAITWTGTTGPTLSTRLTARRVG